MRRWIEQYLAYANDAFDPGIGWSAVVGMHSTASIVALRVFLALPTLLLLHACGCRASLRTVRAGGVPGSNG